MASNFIIKYQSNKRRPHEDKDKDLSYVVTIRTMFFSFFLFFLGFWKLWTKKDSPLKIFRGTCQHFISTFQASNTVRKSLWVVFPLPWLLSCRSISIKLIMVARLLCKILRHIYANYQTGCKLSLNSLMWVVLTVQKPYIQWGNFLWTLHIWHDDLMPVHIQC